MQAIPIRALRHSVFSSPLLLTPCDAYLQRARLTPRYDIASPDKTVEDGLVSGQNHGPVSRGGLPPDPVHATEHCPRCYDLLVCEPPGQA